MVELFSRYCDYVYFWHSSIARNIYLFIKVYIVLNLKQSYLINCNEAKCLGLNYTVTQLSYSCSVNLNPMVNHYFRYDAHRMRSATPCSHVQGNNLTSNHYIKSPYRQNVGFKKKNKGVNEFCCKNSAV